MDLRPLLNVCRIFQSNIHLSSWLGVIFTCTLIHIVFKYFNGIVNSILLYYFNVNERIYVSCKFKPITKTRKKNEMAIKCANKCTCNIYTVMLFTIYAIVSPWLLKDLRIIKIIKSLEDFNRKTSKRALQPIFWS